MFGYVKPCIPELKIKDYEIYKAIYCGLCKNMGENFGQVSRLTLNYDFAFLSLLSASLTEDDCNFEEFRCFVHPTKNRYICLSQQYFDYTSNIAIVMLYHKMLDNIGDNGVKDKLIATASFPVIKGFYKKAQIRYEEIKNAFENFTKEQSELEKNCCTSIDMSAEPTANIMSLICENIGKDENQKMVLKLFGYHLGKWVYLIDAVDDFKDDIIKKNYNPFSFELKMDKWTSEGYSLLKPKAEPRLYMTLAELIKAYELLDIKRFKPLMDNIILKGLRETTDKIISKGDL